MDSPRIKFSRTKQNRLLAKIRFLTPTKAVFRSLSFPAYTPYPEAYACAAEYALAKAGKLIPFQLALGGTDDGT